MRDPSEAAHAWFERAGEQTDPFDRFISLWIAFNVLYGSSFRTSERQAIGEFIYGHRLPRNEAITLLNQPCAQFFRRRVIRDVRSFHDPQRGIRDTYEEAVTLSTEENLPGRR